MNDYETLMKELIPLLDDANEQAKRSRKNVVQARELDEKIMEFARRRDALREHYLQKYATYDVIDQVEKTFEEVLSKMRSIYKKPNVMNDVENFGKSRRSSSSFLNKLKALGRNRSRSVGGKRKQKMKTRRNKA